MLRLHTLGGAYLTDDAGQPLAGAATQRRTLALLAVLAAAGEAGLSRDKLVGVLWPDADAERARHSLTQGLYATRRALQIDDLFVASASVVSLNPDRIGSDVDAFEKALAGGDLEQAVALYRGPFLDGLFISGSPEFEQWSSAQRERLQASVMEALGQLATRDERAGAFRQAVEWRRRLAGLLPLDASVTVDLMNAMASAGDRAGALQQARLHAALLREELELDPDPVVEALAARLRAGVSWSDDSQRLPADAALVDQRGGADEPVVHRAATELPQDATVWPAHQVTRPPPQRDVPLWMRWAILSVVIAVLVGAGVLIGRARKPTTPDVGELAVRQRVLVAPFRVAGAEPSLAYLRDGMVELLSTRLADDSASQSVDAGAALGAWRAAGLAPAMDVPRESVVQLAAKLGAERVVVGSVVGSESRMILRASVLAVPSGAPSAEATVAGPADSLTTLIDRLAAQLLTAEAGEDEQLALHTTRSLSALRAFLAGQAALRAMDYAEARRHYDVALRRDSTFALAALQAAAVADRLLDAGQLRRNLALAWSHRTSLNARDRLLLSAFTGPRYPAPSTATEQRAAWQDVVDSAPTSAEIWFTLGTRIYHDGAMAEMPAPRARAAEALQRALAAGPHAPARGLLVVLGERADTLAAVTLGPFAPFAQWRSAIARVDSAARQRIRDTLFRLGPANLRAIAMASQYDAVALDDGAEAIELLGARATRASERVDAILAEHSLALNRGRPRDALAATVRLQRVQPSAGAALRLRVLDAVFSDGDSSAAASAARELAALAGDGAAMALATSDSRYANLCALGQWQLRRGDAQALLRTAGLLRGGRTTTIVGAAVSASPGACLELLEAGSAVLARSRDAQMRVRRLDSLVLAAHVVGDLETYAPIALARLHERLGDSTRALAAIRRRGYMSGWPRYLSTMLREEARLAERAGDEGAMRGAYEGFLRLRGAAGAELAPDLSSVRRRLSASADTTIR